MPTAFFSIFYLLKSARAHSLAGYIIRPIIIVINRSARFPRLRNDSEDVARRTVDTLHIPVPRVDPRSLPSVVIDEVHLSVKVLGDVPPFRKRYLPIPSSWHISMRSRSIQNLSLYLRAVDGCMSVRASARSSGRIHTRVSSRPT